MESAERIRLLEGNLDRQLAWIRAADGRSALAFALNTGMLGVLAAVSPKQATAWNLAPAIFAAFAVTLALASLACVAFVSFPRVKGPRGSIVFFGGIAQRTAGQFKEAITALSDGSYIDDLANQCHRNAEIATAKFYWVQRAFGGLFLAVPFWCLAVFLLYNGGQ
jgi:hypothetical protein